MSRRALIIGSAGQDGTLLKQLLCGRGDVVMGLRRGDLDIADPVAVTAFVGDAQPDEVYFLAAHHHSSEDAVENEGELFRASTLVNFMAAVNFLEAISSRCSGARFVYAASSLVFGPTDGKAQDERTPMQPDTVYGITKMAGMLACRRYRETHGLHASSGILYNHESPLRPARFISRKIAIAAANIARTGSGELLVGDLDARVDWGYAPDYVDAMVRIVGLDRPGEFVVATGSAHTVREFAEIAFRSVGLDYRNHVRTSSSVLQRRLPPRIGDPSKLVAATGWRPSIDFAQMVTLLVKAEVERTSASPDISSPANGFTSSDGHSDRGGVTAACPR